MQNDTKSSTKIERDFYRKLFLLSTPIMVQVLMSALVAVADTLMLGRLDQNQMSAVSLATQVQFIQLMVITAVTSTASILGAQYWGKGDKKTLLEIFNIALRLSALVCVCFFAACELCPRTLMQIFTNEQVLIDIGIGYLKVAGWSYLLVGISASYLTIMKVSEHTQVSAYISILTVILNIMFNAVFIYGMFGLPEMKAEGAALSTLLCRITELLICIGLSLKKDYIAPDLKRIFCYNKLLSGDYAKCMLPLLGASLVWGIGFTSYTAFMGHLGTDAAAANSIAATVRDCVCCATDGFAVGGGILIGNELGAGQLERARKYGDRLVLISYGIGIGSTAIMLILTPIILHLVALTPQATDYMHGIMIVMAVYMIGRAVNTITINGIFSAGGDTLFDLYSLAVVMWCLAVPLAAMGTFAFHWHPVLIYACTCLDEVGKIPWVMFHYKKYKWVKDLTRQM